MNNKLLGCDTVVHCAGKVKGLFERNIWKVNVEGTANLLQASERQNVDRFIFISSFDTRTGCKSCYAESKRAAENLVKTSCLAYIIVRPAIMYGKGDRKNIGRLVQFIKKSRIIPVLGTGAYKWQPVYVGDVAKAVARYTLDSTNNNCCVDVVGPDKLSFNEIVDMVSQRFVKKTIRLHVPIELLRAAAKFLFSTANLCLLDNMIESCTDKLVIDSSGDNITMWGETSLSDGLKNCF
jgi:NADH dehydrogenase